MRIMLVMWVVLAAGAARAEAPAAVAKKIVTAQVAALTNTDDSVIAKTFAPDAVVMITEGGAEEAKSGLSLLKAGITGSMHAFISKAKLASLTAGGNAKMVWIGAEIELTLDQQTSETTTSTRKQTVRLTELAIADGTTWKVIAAMFAPPGSPTRDKTGPSAIEGATAAGPLARILISPSALSSGLSKDAATVVFGTDKGERGIGAAPAKKLIDSWKSLKLEVDGAVREVRTTTYGFVQANVKWVKPGGEPYRMRALMIATPDPTGTWTIVAVHYAVP